MSFRGRLLVFFTIIVVIPMIAVALVLFKLTEDSEHGKVDSRLAGGLQTTLSFYETEDVPAEVRPFQPLFKSDALIATGKLDGDTIKLDVRFRSQERARTAEAES